MKDAAIQNALARLMVSGVILASIVMLVGLALYLPVYGGRPEGDKIFTGEPSYLRDPIEMMQRVFVPGEEGHRRGVIMAGVLLLLLNPIVRVAFAAVGFAAQRDTLYTMASLAVLGILAVSFFW